MKDVGVRKLSELLPVSPSRIRSVRHVSSMTSTVLLRTSSVEPIPLTLMLRTSRMGLMTCSAASSVNACMRHMSSWLPLSA